MSPAQRPHTTPVIVLGLDRSQSLQAAILRGVVLEAREHQLGYRFVIERFLDRGSLRAGQFAGLIGPVYTKKREQQLRLTRIPVVNISNACAAITLPRVVSDDLAVGHMAADYLAGKGLHHFGFLGMDLHFSDLRQRGFVTRLERLGFSCRLDDQVEQSRVPDFARSKEHLWRQVAQWLRKLPKPVGIFACNDFRARHALAACDFAGIKVPDEVSVLGVDNDHEQYELWGYEISSVELAGEQIGRAALRTLHRMRRNPKTRPPPQRIAPLRVVTRRSTDVIAVTDPHVMRAVRAIREQLHKPDVLQLALRQIPVSRRMLDRRCRAALGRSLRAQVEWERIGRARQLLLDTQLAIKEIADRTGFNDPRRLSLVFRSLEGIPPSVYRDHSRGSFAPRQPPVGTEPGGLRQSGRFGV